MNGRLPFLENLGMTDTAFVRAANALRIVEAARRRQIAAGRKRMGSVFAEIIRLDRCDILIGRWKERVRAGADEQHRQSDDRVPQRPAHRDSADSQQGRPGFRAPLGPRQAVEKHVRHDQQSRSGADDHVRPVHRATRFGLSEERDVQPARHEQERAERGNDAG